MSYIVFGNNNTDNNNTNNDNKNNVNYGYRFYAIPRLRNFSHILLASA